MSDRIQRSASSHFLDALEGEESFVEVECVLPHDQQLNEKKWKSFRLKEKRAEAAKKTPLTVRAEVPAQNLKRDDVTNFDHTPS